MATVETAGRHDLAELAVLKAMDAESHAFYRQSHGLVEVAPEFRTQVVALFRLDADVFGLAVSMLCHWLRLYCGDETLLNDDGVPDIRALCPATGIWVKDGQEHALAQGILSAFCRMSDNQAPEEFMGAITGMLRRFRTSKAHEVVEAVCVLALAAMNVSYEGPSQGLPWR